MARTREQLRANAQDIALGLDGKLPPLDSSKATEGAETRREQSGGDSNTPSNELAANALPKRQQGRANAQEIVVGVKGKLPPINLSRAKVEPPREESRGLDATPADDLVTGQLPKRPGPEIVMSRIIESYEQFARTHPELIEALLRECERIAEEHAPPDALRRLTTKQAAQRIGISAGHVSTLRAKARLGECVEGKPRYSKKECDLYRNGYRLPGPKPKFPSGRQ